MHKAMWWSAVERFGQQALQVAVSLVLARMLTPADYGLVGMLAIFFAFASALGDAGFGVALIQRMEISPDDEKSVLVLNVFSSAVITGILCLISPLVAVFFRQPIITPLLCVLSLQIFLNSFGLVQIALLTRQLNFKTQAVVSISSTVLSGIFGILVAANGGGIWSLVVQAVSRSLLRTVLLWALSTWRPSGRFSWISVGHLWKFSSPLLAAGLIDTVFGNLYSAVLGRVTSAQEVGNFTTANQIQQAPSVTVAGVLGNVLLPAFSRNQKNSTTLKRHFRKALRILSAPLFPAMLGLAAMSHNLVLVVLTSKWLGCVPMLRVLSIVGMLYPFHALHLSLLKALGRSDLFFKLEVVKKIIVVALLAMTWNRGAMAIVWGMLAASALSYVVNSYYTLKLLSYSWRQQASDLTPSLFAGALCVLPAAFLDSHIGSGSLWYLSLQLFSIVCIGSAILFLLRKVFFTDFWATLNALTTRQVQPAIT
jgi:teichuronic acid exporter